ncbi:MAG: TorF family putative porin [Gammaproteobacteria bacterium]
MRHTALIASALLAAAGAASAEEAAAPTSPFAKENFSVTASFATDYLFRGLSNSDNDPAFQPAINWGYNGWYAGIWGSNVDDTFDDGADIEIDFYVGYAGDIGNFHYDLGATYYTFPGADDTTGEDNYWELIPKVSYTFESLPLQPVLGFQYAYSPEFFGEAGESHDIEITGSFSLPSEFTLKAIGGHQSYDGTGPGVGDAWNYSYWSIGVARTIAGFDFSLAYWDTTDNAEQRLGDDIAGDHVLFTVSRTFGF